MISLLLFPRKLIHHFLYSLILFLGVGVVYVGLGICCTAPGCPPECKNATNKRSWITWDPQDPRDSLDPHGTRVGLGDPWDPRHNLPECSNS